MFDKVLNSVKEAVEEIELELSLDYEDCITKAVVHDKVWEKLPADLKEKYKNRLFHHPYAPEDTIMFVRSPKHYEPPKLVYGEFCQSKINDMVAIGDGENILVFRECEGLTIEHDYNTGSHYQMIMIK